MKRDIILIDDSKCDGCGDCVTGCHEGALQIINGKAVLINEFFCDGLGACLGKCPNNAITVERRDALPYNESEVIKRITEKGKEAVNAHLKHLTEHGQTAFYNEAVRYLEKAGFDFNKQAVAEQGRNLFNILNDKSAFNPSKTENYSEEERESALENWPIQLHLINPRNPDFYKADILLAADCTAFSAGDFHNKFLKGKKLLIACPKLDSDKNIYIDKIISLIDDSHVSSITVAIMEVPCCSGLLRISELATESARTSVKMRYIKFGINGDLIESPETEHLYCD